MRRARREARQQARFVGVHTPKQASHVAGAEAKTEYAPVIRNLQSERRASRKREKQLGQWYGQLGSDINQSAQQALQAFALQQGATTQRLSDAGQRDQAANAALSAADAATASLLGAPTDSKGAAQRQAGATALAQQRVSMAAPLSAEQANYVRYLGGRRVSASQQGIEARQNESARRRKIKEDIRAARKEQGQAKVKNIETLREGDRGFRTDTMVAQLNSRKAAVDARQGAARLSIERQNAGTSARNAATSERNATTSERSQKATAHHYKTEGHGLTPSEKHSIKEGHRNAQAAAKILFESKKWPSWAALEKAVAKESEVSPADAKRAVEHLRKHVEKQEKVRAATQAVSGF